MPPRALRLALGKLMAIHVPEKSGLCARTQSVIQWNTTPVLSLCTNTPRSPPNPLLQTIIRPQKHEYRAFTADNRRGRVVLVPVCRGRPTDIGQTNRQPCLAGRPEQTKCWGSV